MVTFEGYERRIDKITEVLKANGIESLEECQKICLERGIDVEKTVRGIQVICFDNAVWAYTLGTALAIKNNAKNAEEAARYIGQGLQAFTVKGSVAETREVGLGHGNLAAKLLNEKTKCFCFLAGHESFAAAEGALGIALNANKARKTPLKVILNGLGKDAAYIISRINGFTYVDTVMDYKENKLVIKGSKRFSEGPRGEVLVYGSYDPIEGVEIMKHESVDISITGNSTNPVRFQHPVAGIYKAWCQRNGREYFSVASGGGTGRTLHPDNLGAGPASYGLTDTMGRMHADAQFAGSSSVPAHVDMMGLIGMGNNPMVGASVSLAVQYQESLNK